MKNEKIDSATLRRFIKLFLPEDKIIQHRDLELKAITGTICASLGAMNRTADLQDIFKAFCDLDYPHSINEPLQKGTMDAPYIMTNSHAIYFAINKNAVDELNKFSKMISRKDYVISDNMITMFISCIVAPAIAL